MARKNLLDDLVAPSEPEVSQPAMNYPMRGASKSMIRSLDEIARQAEKFLEGEAVVELDPDAVDMSFVTDRLADDPVQFEELKAAIAERGQDSPVLVRPHPTVPQRYQLVFGHRRLRAARELGRKVRAVVKTLDDRSHVIAQGQENSARANLTFIERALFARRLEDLGYDREVISSALAANAASLSKMVSVTGRIPEGVIRSIGPAPSVGRERWVEMSLLVGKPGGQAKIDAAVVDPSFEVLDSDERFGRLFAELNKTGRPVRKVSAAPTKANWQAADKTVSADIRNSGKAFILSMKAKNAGSFGRFLSDNLDRLYQEFMSAEANKGD